ncbi:MAG TPA: class I SAM-dependent methyltransferase [Gemmatimonadales bacterium]|nr:class I SAM-dependent methyltransferase [Gemmatimonadales bacterium]
MSTPAPHDRFGDVAAAYARFRPRYPSALFDFLAGLAPRRDLAWDCATGTGQAAGELARCFRRVVATDLSPRLLRQAPRLDGIAYCAAAAESAPLRSRSAALVTVAQALHWFALDAFYAEARRVLAPGGVLACWTYGRFSLGPALDPLVDAFHRETVGPYWPPERRLVDEGYRSVPFPFEELTVPRFTMEARLTLAELGGYLGTWSAVQRYRRARGEDPVAPFLRELRPRWGDPETPAPIRWPLAVRVGRTPG